MPKQTGPQSKKLQPSGKKVDTSSSPVGQQLQQMRAELTLFLFIFKKIVCILCPLSFEVVGHIMVSLYRRIHKGRR